MKQFWQDIGIAFIMGLIVPSLLLAAVMSLSGDHTQVPLITEYVPATVSEPEVGADNSQRRIPVLYEDGQIRELPLNDYLTSVVLAEMPVSFEEEALKAQTVVARTYTIRAVNGASKHENAAVCTNSTCCQGYIDAEEYVSSGGSTEAVQLIHRLVESTDGQVLTYKGDLIEATYFSCSGGVTEDALAVWGTDVPYLQSVVSPGEEHATYFTDTVTFTAEELEARLAITLNGAAASWFSNITYTDGGGVATIQIGGVEFSGTQLRKLLSLRSTAFSVTAEEDSITIHTRGYGHRVGMSQYGADAMAASGSTYPQILSHYYQGTELTSYAD